MYCNFLTYVCRCKDGKTNSSASNQYQPKAKHAKTSNKEEPKAKRLKKPIDVKDDTGMETKDKKPAKKDIQQCQKRYVRTCI